MNAEMKELLNDCIEYLLNEAGYEDEQAMELTARLHMALVRPGRKH